MKNIIVTIIDEIRLFDDENEKEAINKEVTKNIEQITSEYKQKPFGKKLIL